MKVSSPPQIPEDLSYAKAKKLVTNSDPSIRQALAHHPETPPEILYFLAADKDPAVRRAVAFNENTPRKADLVLTKDNDPQVRHRLANKIGRILPELPLQAKELVLSVTSDILTQLAQDNVEQVRSMLSEMVKELPNAPKDVVKLLAQDSALTVAEPVLQFSPVLGDQDLLDIINTHPLKDVIGAISRRDGVSEEISGAIVETGDVEAILHLLENKTSQIGEASMDMILQEAKKHERWHEALIHRPKLSAKTIDRLSNFVAMQLLHELQERTDIDDDLLLQLSQAIEDRIAREIQEKENILENDVSENNWQDADHIETEIHGENTKAVLKQSFVDDCLDRGHYDDLYAGIAALTNIPKDVVGKMLNELHPKPICALCHEAGISAHNALEIQTRIAKIPDHLTIKPTATGQYSLNTDELAEILKNITK